MTITLPYAFDTSRVVKLILRGVLLLLVVLLVGILYSVLVSRDLTTTLGLVLCVAVVTYFGRLFFKHLTGSRGTITSDAVLVLPPELLGIRLPGPAGRFPIHQFQVVRVERVTNPIGHPIDAQIQPHERVCLVGQGDTPTILVARTDQDAGRTLGSQLAAALKLRYEEQVAPY
jgi:hypothetical protein